MIFEEIRANRRAGIPSIYFSLRGWLIAICMVVVLALFVPTLITQWPAISSAFERGASDTSSHAKELEEIALVRVPKVFPNPFMPQPEGMLGRLNLPEAVDLLIFNSAGRLIISSRKEVPVGMNMAKWDTGGGILLEERLELVPEGAVVFSTDALQRVRGWDIRPGIQVFARPRGFPAFVLLHSEHHKKRDGVSREQFAGVFKAFLPPLVGSILVVGTAFFALARIRENLVQAIGRAAEVIPSAIARSAKINAASLPCAEFVELAKLLDRSDVFRSLQTAEQRAMKRAEEAQASVRQVLNSVYDAVFVVGRDSKIHWVNRRMEQIFGFPRREAISRNLAELAFSPEDAVHGREQIDLAWSGEPQIFEWQCRHFQTGLPMPCEVYARHVMLPETEIVCVSVRDVTLAKKNEQTLREAIEEVRVAKEKAEEATRAKSEFLARMSHEIRTPMNAILGISYIAARDCSDPEQRTGFLRIHRAAENLLRIINDILDFSKLEAGKVSIEKVPFNLAELATAVSDVASVRCAGKDVRFVVEPGPDLPEAVHGDSLRINQVLLNLVENAIKFTEHGTVTLSIGRGAAPGLLRFEVRDEGIGMTSEQIGRLFQSFEQADGSISRKFGGTGLGLSICKKLVELMGGTIGVNSEPGKGSCFFFEIPLREVSPEEWRAVAGPDASSAGAVASLSGKKILVVDDNEINREIARGLLAEFSCIVKCVPGGKEALAALAAERFDLVLLDLEMPGMDGFFTARKIREMPDETTRRLPLVALSAHVLGESRARAFAAGMNGYLTKPIDIKMLQAELVRHLAPKCGSAERIPDAPPPSPAPRESPTTPPFLNTRRALALLGGNKALFERMAASFLENHANFENQISGAEGGEARRLAHTLKGLAASLGCQEVSELAAGIEASWKSGTRPEPEDLAALFSALEKLRKELRAFLGNG